MKAAVQRAAERYGQLVRSVTAPAAKPLFTQLYEILKLRNGQSKISAKHYFWMNFGSREIYRNADLNSFGGTYHTVALHQKLNSPYWDAVVTDKLTMSAVFARCKIPQPDLYAAACRYQRQLGDVPVFHDKPALVKFIKETIAYPFFCKPVKGGSAKGCQRVEGIKTNGRLALADGSEMPPEEFVDSLEDPEGWGFLIQEAVLPHPGTREYSGDAVTGCRVVILLGDDGPKIFRVVWKLPAPGSYVDNVGDGSSGCWQADVDPASGRVTRVVVGAYTDLKVNPPLPATGRSLVGEQVPDWEQLKRTMESAARAFPGFRFQHWDVGLTSKGPIVYELNTAGAVYGLELSKGAGIFDEEFKRFLAMYGNQARREHFAGGPPVNEVPAQVNGSATLPETTNSALEPIL